MRLPRLLMTALFGLGVYASASLPANAVEAEGAVANFQIHETPQALPETAFRNANDAEVSLSGWKGRVVLLNIWATWCGPCREEMPGLNRLQAEMGSPDFEVVAVSTDRGGAKVAKEFLDEIGADHLALYIDKYGKIARSFGVRGLPATILISADGMEVGRMLGPAEWDSEDAKKLIRHYLPDHDKPVQTMLEVAPTAAGG